MHGIEPALVHAHHHRALLVEIGAFDASAHNVGGVQVETIDDVADDGAALQNVNLIFQVAYRPQGAELQTVHTTDGGFQALVLYFFKYDA